MSELDPRKLGWVFFMAIFGGTLLTLGYIYAAAVRHRDTEIRREARERALAAAALVDVELHEQLVRAEQRTSADYDRLLRPLVKFHRDHPSIQYLWTTRVPAAGEPLLLLETSTHPEIRKWQLALGRSQDILPFLAPDPVTELGRKSLPVLRGGQAWVAEDIYVDAHGSYIEARAPLVDRDGKFIGYLGVDYALDSYSGQINEVRLSGAIALGLALIISIVFARVAVEMRRQTLVHVEQVKRAEAEMRVQRDAATKAAAAKSELLAIATHDLKNPLSAIAGMAGLMLRLKRKPEAKASADDELEMLDSIHAAAKHMGEIVRGILSNEGLEQGGVVFRPAPLDLAALVREVVRFNAPYAARKRIMLEAAVPETLPVVADAGLLREACDNYVSNAIKYSPADTGVRVALRPPEAGGEVEFSVQDAGPGLSEADQAKLFQKFRKLTARPTGGESSTGLGLSIVKTIAERHGGTVGCESTLGQGARFWLRVPLRPPAGAAAETSDST